MILTMSPPAPTVKSKRHYDSERRREQARRTANASSRLRSAGSSTTDTRRRRSLRSPLTPAFPPTPSTRDSAERPAWCAPFGNRRSRARDRGPPRNARTSYSRPPGMRTIIEGWAGSPRRLHLGSRHPVAHARRSRGRRRSRPVARRDGRRPAAPHDRQRSAPAAPPVPCGPASRSRRPPMCCGHTAPELYELLVLRRGWSRKRFRPLRRGRDSRRAALTTGSRADAASRSASDFSVSNCLRIITRSPAGSTRSMAHAGGSRGARRLPASPPAGCARRPPARRDR